MDISSRINNFGSSVVNTVSNKKTLLEKKVVDELISSLYERLNFLSYNFLYDDDNKIPLMLNTMLQKSLQPTPSMPYVIIGRDALKGFEYSSNCYDGEYYQIVPNAIVDTKNVSKMPFWKEIPVFLKAFVNENYTIISDFISDKNMPTLSSNKNNIALLATLAIITPDVINKREIYSLTPLAAFSNDLSEPINQQLTVWSRNSVKCYSVNYFGFKKRINNP